MKTAWGRLTGAALGAFILPCIYSAPAISAGGVENSRMWLACENGRNYPLRPLAVSRENDLITGYMLTTGRGHSVHLRLIPMGDGYRYAGAGIWFDGLRGDAVLNWGRRNAVPCTVAQE